MVGAYGSQAAVLFRTLSVARINFDLTTNVNEVVLIGDDRQVVVSVCASFDGRGLSNRPLGVCVCVRVRVRVCVCVCVWQERWGVTMCAICMYVHVYLQS